jgi:hypothetical protein
MPPAAAATQAAEARSLTGKGKRKKGEVGAFPLSIFPFPLQVAFSNLD